jgi:hypothetical protein
MAQKSNSFEKFWQELKRRKVFGVITTYAATAYIIIEVINNLAVPLNLPSWFATLELISEDFNLMHTKGWGLYKQGKYREALDILQKSWDLRRERAVYNHEANKAVAGLKNN